MLFGLQDEKFDASKGPSIDDLVSKENIDKLKYMGWEIDQGADPVKVSQDWEQALCVLYTCCPA